MKRSTCFLTQAILPLLGLFIAAAPATPASAQSFPVPKEQVATAFGERQGAFIIIDCSSGAVSDFDPKTSAMRHAPCATFKIWSTLIGLDAGILTAPDQLFEKRAGDGGFVEGWNRDLTLREAFRVSSVPAYSELARRIGQEQMRARLREISYGDQNISAGIDDFWLPASGGRRSSILISPAEQATLIRKLVNAELPFSARSQTVLKEIMLVKKTDKGTLYGITGSGHDGVNGRGDLMGLFVGYVESGGRTYAFACHAEGGKTTMGVDARTIVEAILLRQGML